MIGGYILIQGQISKSNLRSHGFLDPCVFGKIQVVILPSTLDLASLHRRRLVSYALTLVENVTTMHLHTTKAQNKQTVNYRMRSPEGEFSYATLHSGLASLNSPSGDLILKLILHS